MLLCTLRSTYIMKRIRSTVNTIRYQAVDSKTKGGFIIFRKLHTIQNKIYYCGTNSSCEKIR
jgi:hypothetical protein